MLRRRETAGDKKKLVLAFDAGCVTCSALARRIEERVGDKKLELRSLTNPQVREWRRRTLGEDAPWAPTLIEVKGTEVRAWTGPGMAVYLSRSLGPVASWRVMQILGEFGSAAASERWGEHPVGALARAVNRRQFLKGAGGAVAGAAVLAGVGWIPLSTIGSSTAQAQTQGSIRGCDFKEPAYSYEELTGAERDTYVRSNYEHNPKFNILWRRFQAYGYKPRPDKARVVKVTYTSGGRTRNAYDLRVPFERVGQKYPVLSVTANASAESTSMAVFERVSETDEASRVDIYRGDRQRRNNGSHYWRVVYTRSWQGPFPLVDAPVVAQEATAPRSELLATEATTSEVTPVSSTEVAASEVVTTSEATVLSPDRNSCEDCGKFVNAIAEYTCYGVAEIGCALVCFEPDLYVDLGSCEPQCGAVIAAVCAAGVPANEDTACSPFCYHEELTGDELVRVAREKALSRDMLNVGPGADWSAGMQVGPVSKACKNGTDDEEECATLICHDPLAGCSYHFNNDNQLVFGEGSTVIKAARHRCTDGNEMLAVSYLLSDGRPYYYYEWRDLIHDGRHKSEAGRYKVENDRAYRDRTSANGKPVEDNNQGTSPSSATSSSSGTSVSTSQYEEDCDCPVTGTFPTSGCSDLNVGCFAGKCGLCSSLAILSGVVSEGTSVAPGLIACGVVVCPTGPALAEGSGGCCSEFGPSCYPCYTT